LLLFSFALENNCTSFCFHFQFNIKNLNLVWGRFQQCRISNSNRKMLGSTNRCLPRLHCTTMQSHFLRKADFTPHPMSFRHGNISNTFSTNTYCPNNNIVKWLKWTFLLNIECWETHFYTKQNVYVAGICRNPTFPEMPRQFRKCLDFPQLPRHL